MNAVSPRVARLATVAALFASALTALPAHALYKVVGPDGKVTYTDRPPTSKENKVATVNTNTGSVSTESLPFELRQVAEKYPVTLYTIANCAPCEGARQFLRQRGVPFTERTVSSADDNAALKRLTGKTELPTISIGSQVMTGFASAELGSYVDAAGYPKESKLPPSYTEPAPTPLTEPKAAPAARPARQAPAATPAPAPAEAPAPSGFKF
jgi:glutaredoxin